MEGIRLPHVALVLYLAFLAVAFGWRTWLQYRLTGDHGFRGLSGRIGSAQWWGGVLLTFGMILGAVAPAAQVIGLVEPLRVRETASLNTAGLALLLAGFALTSAAQVQMRASWRIGVDQRERTALVTNGLFAFVRNPIFSGMLVASTGVVLLAPNPLSAIALGTALAGLEIQVRLVEEPYLLGVHGNRYLSYARTVGRFLPWVGRLS